MLDAEDRDEESEDRRRGAVGSFNYGGGNWDAIYGKNYVDVIVCECTRKSKAYMIDDWGVECSGSTGFTVLFHGNGSALSVHEMGGRETEGE